MVEREGRGEADECQDARAKTQRAINVRNIQRTKCVKLLVNRIDHVVGDFSNVLFVLMYR